jgi:hypothetical protein
MEKLVGKDKDIETQIEVLKKILLSNKELNIILNKLQEFDLFNYYVGAGVIHQTVWNYYNDMPLNYGVKDIDIAYYDNDTSYEKEDTIIKYIKQLLKDTNNYKFDIINEARVHLWYKDKFGYDIEPFSSIEDAISKWPTTVSAIGVKLVNNELVIYAPYGLNDMYNFIVRPNKAIVSEDAYNQRVLRWSKQWPNIKAIPWNN